MGLLICLTVICVSGGLLSLTKLDDRAAEQSALLPFADDPHAARRVAAETGLVCERVVRPAKQPEPPFSFRA